MNYLLGVLAIAAFLTVSNMDYNEEVKAAKSSGTPWGLSK